MIDTHCHIDYLLDADREFHGVLRSAKENGVSKMITISTKFTEFNDKILPLSIEKSIFCTIGTHPNNVAIDDFDIEIADELCTKYKKIVGIGETGLDLYKDENPSLNSQIESLEKHFFIAKKHNKPIIFHSRAADKETITEIAKYKHNKCIIHCFTGTEDFAKKCLDLGCFLSFAGIVTFKNATEIRDALKATPLDRILIETDSPFLAPVPKRGQQNEPSFLKYTAEFIANFLDMEYNKFVKITSKNAQKIFGI